MASIHPSRMALLPQELRETAKSSSPRRSRRSPSPGRDKERDQDRGRGRRDDDDSRSSRPHDVRERHPHRRDDIRDKEDGRGRNDSRGRDRHAEPRRASPKYDDYRRPPPPHMAPDMGGEPGAPWRQQENMYPDRREPQGPGFGGRGGHYAGGPASSSFLEGRRAQREAQTANVWPPSPKAPARPLSPERKSSKKHKSKRHRSPSTQSETDSEDEKRRKERKERKRAKKHEDRKEKKHSSRHHRSHRKYSDEEDSEAEDRHRSRHRSRSHHSDRRSKSKSVAASRSPSPSKQLSLDKMDVDDKKPSSSKAHTHADGNTLMGPPTTIPKSKTRGEESDSDEEVGPQPVFKTNGKGKRIDERAYGGALLRGEGSAMAAFLEDDPDSRIPRRGEIGLTSDEIAKYEDVGYVMSGSRHRRMNAVRMRKENQVISAEEKRGILKLQREERERKEAILRDEFSQLVNERLKGA